MLRSRLIVTVLLLSVTACRGSKPAPAPTPAASISTPQSAITGFLAAAKARDLTTMGVIWGTEKGSARDQMKPEELEKRLVIMQCKLDHSSWKFVEDRPRMGVSGRTGETVDFNVELRLKDQQSGKDVVAKTSIVTVLGPVAKWYVQSVDMAPLGEFCR